MNGIPRLRGYALVQKDKSGEKDGIVLFLKNIYTLVPTSMRKKAMNLNLSG